MGILLIFFVGLLVVFALIHLKNKRKPKNIQDRHVVVTGGSQGIGLEVAIRCAKLGAHVTVIARDEKKLKAAIEQIKSHSLNENQRIQYLSLDLSGNYNNVERSLQKLEEDVMPIYMLVNCAGGAICGRVEDMSIDDSVYMMNINYFGTFYPTRYVLKQLKQTGEGIIVITGSQASLVGVYGLGPYAAAKFALRGLAETIAMETCNTDISVTLALPADTDTPGFANENLSKPEETKLISGAGGLAKPSDIAEQIMKDALTGSFYSVSGLESWLITILCSGLSPWGDFFFNSLLSLLVGPLKLVSYLMRFHVANIIKSCDKKHKN